MIYAKVVTLDGGYEHEEEKIRRDHKIGDVFEVYDIDMGSCHTDIYEGRDYYNSVYFEFFSDFECTEPYDIYSDPVFNPYLNLKETKVTTKEERWEKNLEHLMSGGFGDTTKAETLLNYWYAQADAGYPGARENVKYFEEMVGIERQELRMPPWCKFCKHGYHIFEKGEDYIHCNLSYLGYPVKKDPKDTCKDFEREDTE